jgi:predicted nucleotidyltransferase
MIDFEELLGALVRRDVQFIIVGGVAATLHGSARLTSDIDITYARSSANIDRLVQALEPLHPYLRGAPRGLPFVFDKETVKRGLNFTLVTDAGPIDLWGELSGVGGFDALIEKSIAVELFGIRCQCIDLESLITSKRAAGRPKDLEVIAELEAIREER